MQLRYVTPSGVEVGSGAELAAWRDRTDGFLWLHLDECDDDGVRMLTEDFGFHPQAVQSCRQRAHLPTFHGYADHWFVTVHRLLIGRAGHVHLLQLEQFVCRDALVTLHGPHNPDVDQHEVDRDTDELAARLDSGRLHPKSPSELSHMLVSGLARQYRDLLGTIASRVADLEQHVMDDDLRHPEHLLERMFLVRHELVTVRTMAAHAHEVFGRMAARARQPALRRPGVDGRPVRPVRAHRAHR